MFVGKITNLLAGLCLLQGLCFNKANFPFPFHLWKRHFLYSYHASIVSGCERRHGEFVSKTSSCQVYMQSSKRLQSRMYQIDKLEILQPSVEEDKHCVLMLMQNLLSPEWILVNCQELILDTIVCQERSNLSLEAFSPDSNLSYCDYSWVLYKKNCYMYSKSEKKKAADGKCKHKFCIGNRKQQNTLLNLPIFMKRYTHFLRQTILLSQKNSNKDGLCVYPFMNQNLVSSNT